MFQLGEYFCDIVINNCWIKSKQVSKCWWKSKTLLLFFCQNSSKFKHLKKNHEETKEKKPEAALIRDWVTGTIPPSFLKIQNMSDHKKIAVHIRCSLYFCCCLSSIAAAATIWPRLFPSFFLSWKKNVAHARDSYVSLFFICKSSKTRFCVKIKKHLF